MGVDHDAILVVGAHYEDLVSEAVTETTVTKYNPDTGAPYQTVVNSVKTRIGNTVVDGRLKPCDIDEQFLKQAGLESCNCRRNGSTDKT